MSTFVKLFGHRKLSETVSDVTPVKISSPELAWLELPDEDFLKYAWKREMSPAEDGGTGSVSNHPAGGPVPYMAVQVHRLYVHARLIRKYLREHQVSNLIDIGAFPFSFDFILRERLGYQGNLLATANYPVSEHYQNQLDNAEIETTLVKLDPFIHSEGEVPETSVPKEDGWADMIIFNHVIEHIFHPLHILKEIARLLRSGGILFLGTDNPHTVLQLNALLYAAEPLVDSIEGSTAMKFGCWPGHNRFFSEGDLRTMVEAAGLEVEHVHFSHFIWRIVNDEVAQYDEITIPRWVADLITKAPKYRNEIVVVARKP